ncbi:peptide-methionine (S)-S-oxide reductase MsrA [Robertkochia aurantiaca]|uniref:peptide-methionine (S)-S-oxide reductase MsrA n=1 Tax=Robertkochia aurantiaca TaxID=2873700 RepID=UPI001CCA2EBF|nr:peptide-methionine (S)-S-oxide reductase MsrA [Robertkochia sp. 3YJGBD-33]
MKEESNLRTALLAGGCFWCTEAVFERLEGVHEVVSGYTGGSIKNPAYREICTGRTGHAEGVKITYDPDVISFRGLLEIFFATHDPTTLNRQGNDIGSQYRSAIFYHTEEERRQARSFIEMLEEERIFNGKIVTELSPAGPFYPAEDFHQDYYKHNRSQPYCQVIIDPKLEKLRTLYKSKLKNTTNAV